MQALINELVEKAGLTEEQAQKAVQTMIGFVKTKLPNGLSDKIEDLMSGKFDLSGMFGGDDDDEGGSALDALSGMFGGKR